MLTAHKTPSGWVLEQDGYSPYYGALVAGAIRGRRVLYRTATLRKLDIDPASDPMATVNEHGVTQAEWLAREEPDKVLARGYHIQ